MTNRVGTRYSVFINIDCNYSLSDVTEAQMKFGNNDCKSCIVTVEILSPVTNADQV